ncbi:hypothetical protein PNOK_0571500 [Pyrrhoderma noxium]|uniref:Uncharacterized protein n=1 Tax=Pyrrhoderma noxium TaxID=2282107 RepID=A0A286UGY2_9AGAM|nr:hypothetical protein PNOK_0571500 [Pyrrhoderma noxium]
MSEAESDLRKRKRDDFDPPRITFRALGRTFDRLLTENSLEDVHSAVTKKLKLDHGAKITLLQIRNGDSIDLEDADDFAAFRSFSPTPEQLQVTEAPVNAQVAQLPIAQPPPTQPSTPQPTKTQQSKSKSAVAKTKKSVPQPAPQPETVPSITVPESTAEVPSTPEANRQRAQPAAKAKKPTQREAPTTVDGAEEEPVTAPPKPTNGVASEDGPSHSSTEGQNETTAAAATTTAAAEPKTPAKRTRTTAATKATSTANKEASALKEKAQQPATETPSVAPKKSRVKKAKQDAALNDSSPAAGTQEKPAPPAKEAQQNGAKTTVSKPPVDESAPQDQTNIPVAPAKKPKAEKPKKKAAKKTKDSEEVNTKSTPRKAAATQSSEANPQETVQTSNNEDNTNATSPPVLAGTEVPSIVSPPMNTVASIPTEEVGLKTSVDTSSKVDRIIAEILKKNRGPLQEHTSEESFSNISSGSLLKNASNAASKQVAVQASAKPKAVTKGLTSTNAQATTIVSATRAQREKSGEANKSSESVIDKTKVTENSNNSPSSPDKVARTIEERTSATKRTSIPAMSSNPRNSYKGRISEVFVQEAEDSSSESENESDDDSSVQQQLSHKGNLLHQDDAADLVDDDEIDVEALLKPNSSLVWRDIASSDEEDNEEDAKMTSDEEDEEDRATRQKKRPRNSQGFHLPSSSDEDDGDISDGMVGSNTEYKSPLNLSRRGDGIPDVSQSILIPRSDGVETQDAQSNPTQSPVISSFQDIRKRSSSILESSFANPAASQALAEDYTSFLAGDYETGLESLSAAKTSQSISLVLGNSSHGPSVHKTEGEEEEDQLAGSQYQSLDESHIEIGYPLPDEMDVDPISIATQIVSEEVISPTGVSTLIPNPDEPSISTANGPSSSKLTQEDIKPPTRKQTGKNTKKPAAAKTTTTNVANTRTLRSRKNGNAQIASSQSAEQTTTANTNTATTTVENTKQKQKQVPSPPQTNSSGSEDDIATIKQTRHTRQTPLPSSQKSLKAIASVTRPFPSGTPKEFPLSAVTSFTSTSRRKSIFDPNWGDDDSDSSSSESSDDDDKIRTELI